MDLVPEVVNRLGESVAMNEEKTVVIMPVTDQTLAGLGDRRSSILSALKPYSASTSAAIKSSVCIDLTRRLWLRAVFLENRFVNRFVELDLLPGFQSPSG